MWGAVIVMTPFEGAVRGSLEGSRDGRVYVYNHDELGDRATPLCGTQLTRNGTYAIPAISKNTSVKVIVDSPQWPNTPADES